MGYIKNIGDTVGLIGSVINNSASDGLKNRTASKINAVKKITWSKIH